MYETIYSAADYVQFPVKGIVILLQIDDPFHLQAS